MEKQSISTAWQITEVLNSEKRRAVKSSICSAFLSPLLSSKCRVRLREIINMHNGRVSVELGREKSLIFKLSR